MSLKKLLTLSFAVFVLSAFTPAVFAHEYKDVDAESPYYYAIHYLRRNEVFKNTPYFYPDKLISKAEFIKYLVLLNSPDFTPAKKISLPFKDTRNDAWYAPYFKEAITLGILDERELTAEPDKKLTVLDALTLLFHSQSIPIPNVYKGLVPYTDVVKNKQATPLVMRALSLNIIFPQREDFVGIYQRVSRAQAALMIYRMDLVTLGTATSNGLPKPKGEHSAELDKVIQAWELIEKGYLNRETVDKKALADAVLKSLTGNLDDPYTVYMDESENASFQDSLGGQVEGIGAVVGYNEDKQVVVISPIKGSPAQKAGLMAKDVILEVDGISVDGKTLEEVVKLIKGPKGTTVKIRIQRSTGTKTFNIERDLINIPSVEYEKIQGGRVMRINLSQFNVNAAQEFALAAEAVLEDSNVKGIILDLRGDPGGLLDAAITILGHFVEAQEDLVTIDYADYSQTLLSRGKAELQGIPMVVLINNGSASASEIVAGALRDYKLATLVGETTFGKGSVQQINYFEDNSSLKLTVAHWLTPLHHSIQDNGVDPDISIADDTLTEADEQLDRALQELNRLMK